MNYCRKCQSDYEKPGTCNCFAQSVATMPGHDWTDALRKQQQIGQTLTVRHCTQCGRSPQECGHETVVYIDPRYQWTGTAAPLTTDTTVSPLTCGGDASVTRVPHA